MTTGEGHDDIVTSTILKHTVDAILIVMIAVLVDDILFPQITIYFFKSKLGENIYFKILNSILEL